MESITIDNMVDMVMIMTDIIIENEVRFCELDSVAGDGDFGMSLAKGFRKIKENWDNISKDNMSSFLKECGMIITEYCGGASGPIWGTAFRSASKYLKGKSELSLFQTGELLQSAADGIQKTGGAKLGDKTLLDALIPAAEELKSSAESNDDLLLGLQKGANAAVKGAEKTKEMVASKGRAHYVGERSIGHPDAGACALGIIFTGITDRIIKKIVS